jgi:hypothetical protein
MARDRESSAAADQLAALDEPMATTATAAPIATAETDTMCLKPPKTLSEG